MRALLTCCLAASACHASKAERGEDAATSHETLTRTALLVPMGQLIQLEITQPGKESVTLSNSSGRWNIESPLSYAANGPAIKSILAVLADLEVLEKVAEQPAPVHRLGAGAGIVVKAWTTQGPQQAFVIGASVGERSYVQRVGEEAVYAVRGSCRRFFDLSFAQLRDSTITKLDLSAIERVTYVNRYGEFSLVASPKEVGHFVESSRSIRNFDSERASKNVAVLSELFAKRFVDLPYDRQATGLFSPDTTRVLVFVRGKSKPLTVFIGARTSERLLHLRVLGTEQVYLVSGHLASSLVPQRKHFERSNDEVRGQIAKAVGTTAAPTHVSEHKHGASLPTQVPAKLMKELRELARQQAL